MRNVKIENCVHIYPDGTWNNVHCEEPRGFICAGPPPPIRLSGKFELLSKLLSAFEIEVWQFPFQIFLSLYYRKLLLSQSVSKWWDM